MRLSTRILAAAILPLPVATSAAIAAPSFDCGAATAVEKKICDSEVLSALDRELAPAYQAALGRLAGDAAAVRALRVSQQQFIALRDKALVTTPDRAEDF